jgi:hypothetical protein
MKPKTYKLLEECITNGTQFGINRAFKHTDNPSKEAIQELVVCGTMNEICEWFDFEEDIE